MLINLNFFSVQQAGRTCLERMLAIDDLSLPDYPRPLKKITKQKIAWTPTTFAAFAKEVIHGLMP